MPELTPELIADLAFPSDLDLSPDGRFVAYALVPSGKREEHPTSAIWVAPVDGARPPRQFTAGTSDDRRPRWSPDGTALAFLSDRAKRGTAQLYLIAADGGEARALTPATNKKPVLDFAWSPTGRAIAFTSADEPTADDERREKERDDPDVFGERWPYARLRILRVETGEITTLVATDHHVAGLCWSPDGASIAYLLQEAPPFEFAFGGREVVIARVPAAGGEPREVGRFPHLPFGLRWSTDGATLLFVGSVARQPQSSSAIYAVPATGGEPRRIALGDASCAAGLEQPLGAARAVVGEARGLGTSLRWLDPVTGALDPLHPSADADLTGEFWGWSARATDEGVALAVALSLPDSSPEVWAGRSHDPSAAPDLRRVTHHQSSLDGSRFGRQEAFTWTAPDGWELDGILIRPSEARDDGPRPMVVLVHGGPYGRSGPGFHLGWADWGQWLATAGYAVLLPNPRGGFGHGERFAAAARGDVGGADFRDVMAAVDAAVARGIADPERLGIGGWSQGGFMTAWAVTQTRRFKAGVMGAGVSDWGMMVMTSDLPDFERALGGSAPWEGTGPHRHAALSPISFARAVTTPLLILHGEKDARVPVSQAIGFHRALRERNVPTELVVYPREPHGIGERAHQIDVLRRVRAWFDRWLKA